jgi:nicotinate-nucleotide pyrophosphorylase (carboxylating)
MVRWRRTRKDTPDPSDRRRRGPADHGPDDDALAGLGPEPSEVTPVRSGPLDAPLWDADEPEAPPAGVPPGGDDPARPRPLLPPRPKWADIPPHGSARPEPARPSSSAPSSSAPSASAPSASAPSASAPSTSAPSTPASSSSSSPSDAASPAPPAPAAAAPPERSGPPTPAGTDRGAPARTPERPATQEPVPVPTAATVPRRPKRRAAGPLPGDAELDAAALVTAGREAVRLALEEDLDVDGDATSLATVPPESVGRADFVARAEGVIAGTALVTEVYDQLDPRITVDLTVRDGDRVRSGQQLGHVVGPLRSILTGERTALNFLTHLSGIATHARAFADAVEGTGCVIRDTRKTTPGLRLLEKAAVRAGGATNHRIGLYDALLVKDNHVAAAGSVAEATRRARMHAGGRHVQIEVRSIAELEEAVAAGARDVLLDNLGPEETATAVSRGRELEAEVGERILLETSGRVTLETVRRYAEAGVDRAAVGALTHSAPQLDIALDVRSEHRPPAVRLYPSPVPGRFDDDSLFDPPGTAPSSPSSHPGTSPGQQPGTSPGPQTDAGR